jgi:hypothetical protein
MDNYAQIHTIMKDDKLLNTPNNTIDIFSIINNVYIDELKINIRKTNNGYVCISDFVSYINIYEYLINPIILFKNQSIATALMVPYDFLVINNNGIFWIHPIIVISFIDWIYSKKGIKLNSLLSLNNEFIHKLKLSTNSEYLLKLQQEIVKYRKY